jgi:1-deoxy-D-xylulose-5-phosphate synthase
LDQVLLSRFIQNPKARIITLEEACLSGGFGAAVLEFAAKMRLSAPRQEQANIFSIGLNDHFVEHGARSILLHENGLSVESVTRFIIDLARA